MGLYLANINHFRQFPQQGFLEVFAFFLGGGGVANLGGDCMLKGIYPEFQVIRGFSQKIPAGLLSYDQIHS